MRRLERVSELLSAFSVSTVRVWRIVTAMYISNTSVLFKQCLSLHEKATVPDLNPGLQHKGSKKTNHAVD